MEFLGGIKVSNDQYRKVKVWRVNMIIQSQFFPTIFSTFFAFFACSVSDLFFFCFFWTTSERSGHKKQGHRHVAAPISKPQLILNLDLIPKKICYILFQFKI